MIQGFAAAGFEDKIKLCLTDMYAGYLEPVKTYLSRAVHQFCWFHINCFHIGAKVHQAERAVKALVVFDKKHPRPLSDAERQERRDLVAARDQAQRHWQGPQRFQCLLMRLLWLPALDTVTTRLDQLIRTAAKVQNPYTILGFPPASLVFTPLKSVQPSGR